MKSKPTGKRDRIQVKKRKTGFSTNLRNAGILMWFTHIVIFGVVSSQNMAVFSAVDWSNYTETFFYSEEAALSRTIGGQKKARIDAIWTGGNPADWRQIRVAIDSNGGDSGTDAGAATGGGSSGGCFVSSAVSVPELGGSLFLIGISLLAAILGLRLVLRSTIMRKKKLHKPPWLSPHLPRADLRVRPRPSFRLPDSDS